METDQVTCSRKQSMSIKRVAILWTLFLVFFLLLCSAVSLVTAFHAESLDKWGPNMSCTETGRWPCTRATKMVSLDCVGGGIIKRQCLINNTWSEMDWSHCIYQITTVSERLNTIKWMSTMCIVISLLALFGSLYWLLHFRQPSESFQSQTPTCTLEQYSNCMTGYSEEMRNCMLACPFPCNYANYQFISIPDWSGKFTNPAQKKWAYIRLENLYKVDYPLFSEAPAVTWEQFLAELGGTIDFYLSISVIAILHVFVYLIKQLIYIFNDKTKTGKHIRKWTAVPGDQKELLELLTFPAQPSFLEQPEENLQNVVDKVDALVERTDRLENVIEKISEFLLITLIKRRKHLNSTFFDLCISLGCADIYYTIHKYAFTIIPRWYFKNYFITSDWLGVFTKSTNWAIYYIQITGVLLIALNRHSALSKPFKYKKTWNKKLVKKAVILQLLIGFVWIPVMVLPGYSCHYTEEFGEPNYDDPEIDQSYWLATVIIECSVYAPGLIFLYGHAFFSLIKRNNQVADTTTRSGRRNSLANKKSEMRLGLVGLIPSGMYLCLVFCWITFAIGSPPKVVTVGWYYMSDLFVLTNPYLLLVFSSVLRKQCKAMVCGDNNAQVRSSVHLGKLGKGISSFA